MYWENTDINSYACADVIVVTKAYGNAILGLDFQRSKHCTINVAKGGILLQVHVYRKTGATITITSVVLPFIDACR